MDNLVRRGSESNLDKLARHGVTFVHGDVRNAEDFENLPSGIAFVCDTSAQPSVVSGYSNPVFDITNNSLGVIRVPALNGQSLAHKNKYGRDYSSAPGILYK